MMGKNRMTVFSRDILADRERRLELMELLRESVERGFAGFTIHYPVSYTHLMNYTPTMGWYYSSGSNRSPSWTGVVYLYNFLTGNKSAGPYLSLIHI